MSNEITGNISGTQSIKGSMNNLGSSTPGGAVSSVNGKTGAVVLTASDVGALPDTTPIPEPYDDTVLSGRVTEVESDVSELNENKINEPTTDGTAGQVLTTDGNGGRSWTTPQGGSGDEWELMFEDVLAEDGVSYVRHTFPDGFNTEEFYVDFSNLWRSAGTGAQVWISFGNTSTDSYDGIVLGSFINTSSYPSNGKAYLKRMRDIGAVVGYIVGRNSGGNSTGNGTSARLLSTSGLASNVMHFSLGGYASAKMGAGAVIKFYGKRL